MKIGVFGDSYASRARLHGSLPWHDVIKLKTLHSVDVFGVDGTCLYDAIKKIKLNHSKYDKIVLVATHPGRIHINDQSLIKKYNINIAGLQTIEHSKQRAIDGEFNIPAIHMNTVLSLLDSIYNFYLDLHDDEYDLYLHRLMINDLKTIRPEDLILVPGFRFSTSFDINQTSLFDVFWKENKAWGLEDLSSIKHDKRNCHMTAENNVVFANKIIDCLNGKPLDLNLDDFITPTLDDKKNYIEEK